MLFSVPAIILWFASLCPLVLFMVQWVSFVQIWERSCFSVWISTVESPQNPFSKVPVVSSHLFFTEFQRSVMVAAFKGCPFHEFRIIWETFLAFHWCPDLNEPISGTFICPAAQLLWNYTAFHPPRLNKCLLKEYIASWHETQISATLNYLMRRAGMFIERCSGEGLTVQRRHQCFLSKITG